MSFRERQENCEYHKQDSGTKRCYCELCEDSCNVSNHQELINRKVIQY